MRSLSFFFFFILIFSYSVNAQKIDYTDSDLIIEEIINNNDFKAKKTDSTKSIICSTPKDFEIDFTAQNIKNFENLFISRGPGGNPRKDTERFLFKKDYKTFVTQYVEKPKEISNYLKNKYRNLNISAIQEKENSYEYLHFSKPLFSRDKQTAYIEVDYFSGGYYGDGTAYILKKVSNKWIIVNSLPLWIT